MGKALPKVRNQMCEVNRRGKYTAEPFYTSFTVISGLKCSERKANCSNFHPSIGGIHADSQTPGDFPLRYFTSLRFSRNNPYLRISFDTWSNIPKSLRNYRSHLHPSYWPTHLPEQGRICHTNLWMRLVRGSISFFPSLGSNGVRAPNYSIRRKVS